MTLNKAIFREHPELLSDPLGNSLQDSKTLFIKVNMSRRSYSDIA